MPDPLILTAAFDPVASAIFKELRTRWFPPRLNLVPAHLTLFHKLPGEALGDIADRLHGVCAAEPALPFAMAGLRNLGRGVALEIACEGLSGLRGRLATQWTGWLGAQDRQGWRPHVTVQNKATPDAARALLTQLRDEGVHVSGQVVGLALWHYRGGPWELAGTFGFGQGHPD